MADEQSASPTDKPVVAVTANQATTMTNSAQIGMVDTVNILREREAEVLFARQVNDAELDRVRDTFVSPDGFAQAESILAASRVVVLHGVGSGRMFTGLRLLAQQECQRIVHLSRARDLGSVKDTELCSGDGYLWDFTDHGMRPFRAAEFEHTAQLVAGIEDCWLVIVVGTHGQVPNDITGRSVELRPPDAVAIADAAIRRQQEGGDADKAVRVLHDEFAAELSLKASPQMALQAADLAIRVAATGLSVELARQTFIEGTDKEVSERIDSSWNTMEFTMMFTVALLENEPFEEVVRLQRVLDDLVREKELPSDKKLRPRRAFHKPNDRLLATVGAHTELRDNPSHRGQQERTVQFTRPGWAEAVLCRIWQHYHAEHALLLRWMCDPGMSVRHFENCVRALSTLVSKVPARDRTGELDRLVVNGRLRMWELVAATLLRLKDTPGFADLVEQTVRGWAADKSAGRRCAAVVFYGHRFDRSEQVELLDRITEIAKDPRPLVGSTVVATVLLLLNKSDRLDVLLPMVADWSAPRQSRRGNDGRQIVALDVGMYIFRLHGKAREANLDIDLADVVRRFPLDCRYLMRRIMKSQTRGEEAIDTLVDLATWHPLIGADRRAMPALGTLVRLVHLLTPDLRWWQRRGVVAELCHLHPDRRPFIRLVFRTARKVDLLR